MGLTAVLLVLLIVLFSMILGNPETKAARRGRREAEKTLLSGHYKIKNTDQVNTENIDAITKQLLSVISKGGSIDNLYHFLSKDPGRKEFPGHKDRVREAGYTGGSNEEKIRQYIKIFSEEDLPPWAPEYLAVVKVLLDNMCRELAVLSGVPDFLVVREFRIPLASEICRTDIPSVSERLQKAVGLFAGKWVPPGETYSTYQVNRQDVRGYLLESRKFTKRMAVMDKAWADIEASLYNLINNPNWKTAVRYNPDFSRQLENITVIFLTGDIHRRKADVMQLVGNPENGPGIIWTPDFAYYKNIPEITGITADSVQTIFISKVNIGYTFRDTRTQTWLNRRKNWLTDYFVSFFSHRVAADFSPVKEEQKINYSWNSAFYKAKAVHDINKAIASMHVFGKKKVYGVRDVAFVKINLIEYN